MSWLVRYSRWLRGWEIWLGPLGRAAVVVLWLLAAYLLGRFASGVMATVALVAFVAYVLGRVLDRGDRTPFNPHVR